MYHNFNNQKPVLFWKLIHVICEREFTHTELAMDDARSLTVYAVVVQKCIRSWTCAETKRKLIGNAIS